MKYLGGWLCMVCLLVTGCSGPTHRTNQQYLDENRLLNTRKILLLPVEATASEYSVMGEQEKLPDWSAKVRYNVEWALKGVDAHRVDLEFVTMPELSERGRKIVDEHLALMRRVVHNSEILAAQGAAWEDKRQNLQFSIGPGLKPLAESTGASVALLIVADDIKPSMSRQAANILVMLAFGPNASIDLGHAAFSLAAIDLRTGQLLWTNTEYNDAKLSADNLSSPAYAGTLLRKAMASYLKGPEYRPPGDYYFLPVR